MNTRSTSLVFKSLCSSKVVYTITQIFECAVTFNKSKKDPYLADRLAALGYRVVLTGSQKNARITKAIAGEMKNLPIDLSGADMNPGLLAALISRACLVISNDAGIS